MPCWRDKSASKARRRRPYRPTVLSLYQLRSIRDRYKVPFTMAGSNHPTFLFMLPVLGQQSHARQGF